MNDVGARSCAVVLVKPSSVDADRPDDGGGAALLVDLLQERLARAGDAAGLGRFLAADRSTGACRRRLGRSRWRRRTLPGFLPSTARRPTPPGRPATGARRRAREKVWSPEGRWRFLNFSRRWGCARTVGRSPPDDGDGEIADGRGTEEEKARESDGVAGGRWRWWRRRDASHTRVKEDCEGESVG